MWPNFVLDVSLRVFWTRFKIQKGGLGVNQIVLLNTSGHHVVS